MNTKDQLSNRLSQARSQIKTTGRNLWLAGLGAVGSADEMSRDLFADFVRRGEKLGKAAGDEVEETVEGSASRIHDLGRQMETRMEDGMSKTLNRLGVPSRRDVEQLSDRVATLTRHVEALRN